MYPTETIDMLRAELDKVCAERDSHRESARVYRAQWVRATREEHVPETTRRHLPPGGPARYGVRRAG